MTRKSVTPSVQEHARRRLATVRLTAAAVLGLALAACGGNDDASPVSIEFATVDQGSQSQLNFSIEFLSRIARTDAEWQTLWISNFFGTRPPPAPAIDFRRFMVVGLFLGGRPSGCYEIAVREVLLSSQEVEVLYSEITPGAIGCQAVVVSPYQFISIPTTTLPVRFRKL